MSVDACIGDFEINFTVNHSGALRALGLGSRFCCVGAVSGMTGEQSAPILAAALVSLAARRDEIAAIAPTGGWGNADGPSSILTRMLAAALKESNRNHTWFVHS